jgi:(2R)-ethylmalonyl-CoA mutase
MNGIELVSEANRLYGLTDSLTAESRAMTRLDARPPWLIRTYAGFGDATQSNLRFHENLKRGQKGLSVAFDLPTQCGYDADHPMASGEVGGTGVAISHLGDMEILFKGLDLSTVNTSLTINATAPWLFSLYVALADKQGIDRKSLSGTTQNDLLKEFVGRGTHIFGPDPSLRLSCDLITFSAKEVPTWNPINACGYHYTESGASPAQEIGFALGNALIVLDNIRTRLTAEDFERVVRRVSFFINSGIELVPEIAKVRAYHLLWPQICKEEYNIDDVVFRAGCQVRSLTLTESQPEVNIVRIAYQSLPVTLSSSARVRALQLPGFREATGLPDQGEQTLALRTQQVLMYETGIADYEDIFEGSIVIERETQNTLNEALELIDVLRRSGYTESINRISETLTKGLVIQRARLTQMDDIRVGVNAYYEPVNVTSQPTYKDDWNSRAEGAELQLSRLKDWRQNRNDEEVASKREQLHQVALSAGNILPASIELAKAGGTTGEWSSTLEEAFGGRYQAPLGSNVVVEKLPAISQVNKPTRILLAKGGLDGHINAIKILAFHCRQAGFEVIYTGLQQTPAAIARTASQEAVDLVALSVLSGAHLHIAQGVLGQLREINCEDIPLVMGGIIPEHDQQSLLQMGVAAVFTPKDSEINKIIERLIEITQKYSNS